MQMRIAVTALMPFASSGGGPISRARYIALGLRAAGAEVTLISCGVRPQDADGRDEISWQGIPVRTYASHLCPASVNGPTVAARMRRGRVYAGCVQQFSADICAWAQQGALDAVILHNQDLWYAWHLARACHSAGVAYIQQYVERHVAADYPHGWLNTHLLWERLHALFMPRRTSGSIAITRYLQRWAERRSGRPALLIPTLGDIPATLPARGSRDTVFVMVTTGTRRDRAELLLEAFALAHQKNPVLKLMLVGLDRGAHIHLSGVVAARGLKLAVALHGFVSVAELERIYRTAYGFVLLRGTDVSSQACFPGRLYELFGYGAPVVLTDIGDFPFYFRDGVDALLVKPEDSADLADKLVWLAANPEPADKVGAQGSATARHAFDPLARGREIACYLENVCARMQASRGQRRS